MSSISKDKQCESLVEKLCNRISDSKDIKPGLGLLFCMSQLQMSVRAIKNLVEHKQAYAHLLCEDEAQMHLQHIMSRARKFATTEMKEAVAELEKVGKPQEAGEEEAGAEAEAGGESAVKALKPARGQRAKSGAKRKSSRKKKALMESSSEGEDEVEDYLSVDEEQEVEKENVAVKKGATRGRRAARA